MMSVKDNKINQCISVFTLTTATNPSPLSHHTNGANFSVSYFLKAKFRSWVNSAMRHSFNLFLVWFGLMLNVPVNNF